MKLKFFLLIVFSLAIFLVGCSIFPAADNQASQKPAPSPELERQYEQQIKTVLAPFWLDQTVTGIRDQILEIRTPAKYLDLHLSLVLAFEALEPAQAQGDQSKIDSALAQINQLKQQYPWLE